MLNIKHLTRANLIEQITDLHNLRTSKPLVNTQLKDVNGIIPVLYYPNTEIGVCVAYIDHFNTLMNNIKALCDDECADYDVNISYCFSQYKNLVFFTCDFPVFEMKDCKFERANIDVNSILLSFDHTGAEVNNLVSYSDGEHEYDAILIEVASANVFADILNNKPVNSTFNLKPLMHTDEFQILTIKKGV